MATEIPWIRWSPEDYLRDTRDLSIVEKGVYSDLLNQQYEGVEIPLDVSRVQRLVGAHGEVEEAAVVFILERYFEKTEAGFLNPRAVEELNWSRQALEQRREAGKKGGRPPKKPGAKPKVNRKETGSPSPTKAGAKPKVNRKETKRLSQAKPNANRAPNRVIRERLQGKRVDTLSPCNHGGAPRKGAAPMGFTPPKHSEVREYAAGRGCPQFDVEKWFRYYEDRRWRLSKGKPMSDWTTSVDFWIGKNHPGSTNRTGKVSEAWAAEKESHRGEPVAADDQLPTVLFEKRRKEIDEGREG